MLEGSENDEKRTRAISRLSQLIHRTIISNAKINSALEVPKAFPRLKEKLLQDHLDGTSALKSVLSQFAPVPSFDPVKEFPKIAASLTEQAVVNIETVVASAVIVLSHSTADDIFTEACGLAIDLCPEKWAAEINLKKTVTLADIKKKGGDGIFIEELERFRKNIGHKSIVERAQLLFRHVPIRQNRAILRSDHSYFRMSVLQEADGLRGSIVHGNALPSLEISKSRIIAAFLYEASTTALRSIGVEFELPIEPSYFFGLRKD